MNRSRITGNLTSHGILYSDIANDRVGIGSPIPGNKLSLPDSAKIGLGNAEDLTLYHNGSHSYIDNTIGNLVIQNDSSSTSEEILIQPKSGEQGIKLVANGQCEIYHDDNLRFYTTSSSVNVHTGVDFVIPDSIIHEGDTNTKIRFPGADQIQFETGGGNRLYIQSDGKIGINRSNNLSSFGRQVLIDGTLGLNNDSGTVGMAFHKGSANTYGYMGTGDWAVTGGATEDFGIAAKGNLIFGTSSGGWSEKFRITSAGLISIGDESNLDSQLTITQAQGDCIRLRSLVTNNTFKYGIIKQEPYNNNALGVQIIGGKSDSSYSEVAIGGGIDGGYAATQIDFYTGATTTTATGTRKLRIDLNGNIQIGAGSVALPKATQGGVDIDSGSQTVCVGGNVNSSGRTNSTDKLARITSPHYTNAEESVMILSAYNQSGTNNIGYGGGSGTTNTANNHIFYTAANTTTTNGTERLRIDSNGRLTLNNSEGIKLSAKTSSLYALDGLSLIHI